MDEERGLPKLLELGRLFHTEFFWLVQWPETNLSPTRVSISIQIVQLMKCQG